MSKAIFPLILLFLFFTSPTRADEGMWLPWMMPQSKIDKMQEMGFQLAAEDIYSSSQPSLKDAIVSLDDGSCTGSFISNRGLLLTNHHCANGDIQSHSSVERDLLKNGFWAQNQHEELPNPGKTATLLIEAKNLTSHFTPVIQKADTRLALEQKIDSLSQIIMDTLSLEPFQEATIKDFNFSTRFFLIITKTFQDVRLVAAPPEDIAQFGGEKDNWTWPRHSADFALYRVYCSPQGNPADYHTENIPYTPVKSLTISTGNLKENDFTMTLGYPGNTQRHMTSAGIREAVEIINPLITEIQVLKQHIWKRHMAQSRQLEIKYAEKYAELVNFAQYTAGQSKSICDLNLIEKRKTQEQNIQQWMQYSPDLDTTYAKLFPSMKALYRVRKDLTRTSFITLETILGGTEISQFVMETFELFTLLNEKSSSADQKKKLIRQMRAKADHFFKDFTVNVDRELFLAMVTYYRSHVNGNVRINDSTLLGKYSDFEHLADAIYSDSHFCSQTKFEELMSNPKLISFLTDPAFAFHLRILQEFGPVYAMFNRMNLQLDFYMHQYLKLLKTQTPESSFYPNANSTLRLSYGKVTGYSPGDGIYYKAFTTPRGIFEKTESANVAYKSETDFRKLFQEDWEDWYHNKEQPTLCFITDNDISGGNSGSPVLNAKGQITGLAFDGNQEGMASDIAYSATLQRCINVDIKYILFLIEEVGKSPYLIEEMNIQ
ncbi:S46 family peptidase [Marinilabilia salmonicolor]|uniref:Dipeptidyl-peptidase n=1 Tax=Marinilabilia salmonicolor TaxID=989 RepID=A0A368VB49_9BACT|nr:S46 family peptidase [Marinilabilia salmonicolor]RCW37465.1 peptidase S46-like protein [Marinilabilia salmonicolor]